MNLCPNGHDTQNEIGNCYTCGEPFSAVDSAVADVAPAIAGVAARTDNNPLSLKTLERLRADAQYIVQACDKAIAELTAKKEG